MSSKFRFGIVGVFLILSLAGTSTRAEVIDKIVAVVDSEIITLVDLNNASKPYLKQLESAGYSQKKYEETKKQIHKKVLDALIDQSLTQQEAKKYGITVSESEVNDAVENIRKNQGLSEEAFEKTIVGEGMTLEAYKESIEKKILQTRLINHAVKSKVVVTESEIKDYYEKHAQSYAGVKKYHLRNILTKDKDLITTIHKRLKQKEDFAALAKAYSIAPNASDGGDLGLFDINNFADEIKKRIQNLQRKEFSSVIKTPQGYQIFYVDDIVVEGGKTFEQAHDEIYDKLYAPKLEEKFDSWLKSLKEQAVIEIKL